MPALLSNFGLHGLTVFPVQVEVEVGRGMPHFSIIGMASTSLQEAKERVRGALLHSGFEFPRTRKVVNLAPAELEKKGSHFDLAIALGLLVASGQVPVVPRSVLVLGELGLDGNVRPISGALPLIHYAQSNGIKEVLLPRENLAEASLVEGLDLIPVRHLSDVVGHLNGRRLSISRVAPSLVTTPSFTFDHIQGHASVKRALMIAAAGGHHALLEGPPGTGKSLLAQAFPSLLPPLENAELLEVLSVHSVARIQSDQLSSERPFRVVHSSLTTTGLMGGGNDLMPGEVSLAHRGVLFMDEWPEFDRHVIEQLRGPMETERIYLRKGNRWTSYPCSFQLLAAMNPCPCGYFGDPEKACACLPHQVDRYRNKISGPILDRMDLHVNVPRLSYEELNTASETSHGKMVEQVREARSRQERRFKDAAFYLNHSMTPQWIQKEPLTSEAQIVLDGATKRFSLSGRGVHRVIKVARTLADLDGVDSIQKNHLLEALHYRLYG